MKHAYLILAHAFPEQLEEIINLLNTDKHDFFIHIDKKNFSEMLNSSAVQNLQHRKNVFFLPKMRSVNWGGANQFFATIDLLQFARARGAYDYYHLISGQDYPVQSNEKIDEFFENQDYSYFGLDVRDASRYSFRWDAFCLMDLINVRRGPGIKKWCCRFQNAQKRLLLPFIRLRRPLPFPAYKGSQWWPMTAELADYILRYLREHPEYRRRFLFTNSCDEVFFHTLAYNSPLKDKISSDIPRYISWKRKYDEQSLPRVLDESDYEDIIRENVLFCRKIDPERSKTLKERLRRKILETC